MYRGTWYLVVIAQSQYDNNSNRNKNEMPYIRNRQRDRLIDEMRCAPACQVRHADIAHGTRRHRLHTRIYKQLPVVERPKQ